MHFAKGVIKNAEKTCEGKSAGIKKSDERHYETSKIF